MAAIHFISGLPRSGSTLLAALLRQNPRFEAGMSGPLAGLFGALLGEMSARNEYSVFIDDAKRERILHGLFDNFYAECTAEVIFDTNRGWCAWMPAIARLFPDAKVIACVRELPWVIDSIERLDPAQRLQPVVDLQLQRRRHGLYPRQRRGGTGRHGRSALRCPQAGVLRRATGPAAAAAIRNLDHRPGQDHARHLRLYRRAGFRARFRPHRLRRHRIRRTRRHTGAAYRRCTVKAEPRETLLPPDLFQRFANDAFWRDPRRVPEGLQVV